MKEETNHAQSTVFPFKLRYKKEYNPIATDIGNYC